MKLTMLLIFMLLNLISITAEYMFGCLDPTGYRAYIYSETLTPLCFSTPSLNLTKDYPDPENFNIIYKPLSSLTLEVEGKGERFKELVEWQYNPFNSLDLRFGVIYSNPEPLLHHTLFFKREGLFSTGLIFTNSFSLIEEHGFKIMGFNSLSLNKIDIISMLEIRSNYISPYNTTQSSGRRSRTIFSLTPSEWAFIEFINDLSYMEDEDEVTRENSLKLKFYLPYTTLTLNGVIKEITKRQFSYGTCIINNLGLFKHELNFDIRYINANLYTFSDTLSLDIINDLTVSATYKWSLIEENQQTFISNLAYNAEFWRFTMKYELPIADSDREWTIKGAIYHTCY